MRRKQTVVYGGDMLQGAGRNITESHKQQSCPHRIIKGRLVLFGRYRVRIPGMQYLRQAEYRGTKKCSSERKGIKCISHPARHPTYFHIAV